MKIMAIKILQVIDHLPLSGGQLPIPENITANLNPSKFESLICSLRPDQKAQHPSTDLITLKYGKWDPRPLFSLIRICKERHIDIIHAHLEKSIMLGILAGRICKVPVIINEHGPIFEKNMTLYNQFIKRFHNYAAAVIAVSQATADELTKKTNIKKDKIEVIYTAIDIARFDYKKVSRKQARENFKVSENDIVIGFVGRLAKLKGVDILINAFKLLLDKSDKYLLLIAGNGPQRQSLELLAQRLGISQRVRFLGLCRNMPELISAFDIGVMPSLHEPFGRVAIELMRMKVPVVCSGLAGLAELVIDGKTGIVVTENTPEGNRDGIEKLINNEALRQSIVEQAYIFSEKFGIMEQVKKLETLYEKVYASKT